MCCAHVHVCACARRVENEKWQKGKWIMSTSYKRKRREREGERERDREEKGREGQIFLFSSFLQQVPLSHMDWCVVSGPIALGVSSHRRCLDQHVYGVRPLIDVYLPTQVKT